MNLLPITHNWDCSLITGYSLVEHTLIYKYKKHMYQLKWKKLNIEMFIAKKQTKINGENVILAAYSLIIVNFLKHYQWIGIYKFYPNFLHF